MACSAAVRNKSPQIRAILALDSTFLQQRRLALPGRQAGAVTLAELISGSGAARQWKKLS